MDQGDIGKMKIDVWNNAPVHAISEIKSETVNADPVEYNGTSIYTENLKRCMLGFLKAAIASMN